MRLIADSTIGILTVYGEARGETFAGKVAVAEVILNRTKQKYASDGTVIGTCLHSYQFSSWNSTEPNRISMVQVDDQDPVLQECMKAWNTATLNVTTNSTSIGQSVLYYNPRIPAPAWVADSEFVATIDHHSFYRPKGTHV